MNILLAAAEVTPFAKAGGLADVASALPKAWDKLGHNVVVIIPLYGNIDRDAHGIRPTGMVVGVPIGNWTEYAHIWRANIPDSDVPVYFIQNADYFDRQGIYGNPDGFADNDRRFIFLSKAVFEVARALGFKPDIIHAHDYHTSMAMAYLKINYKNDPLFSQTAGVFTIHNMAYQGIYEPKRVMDLSSLGMRHFFRGSWFEHQGYVNFLKAGVMFADKISAVSPTYAHEIRWTKAAEGLAEYMHERSADLVGILNGVDYEEWSPDIDADIYTRYSEETLEDKAENKMQFLAESGLTKGELENDLPLVGMVTRLTWQKGIDLLEHTIENFVKYGAIRFALLGSGERRYEDFFRYLAGKYPRRVFVRIGYSNPTAHRLIAASDFLLVPSRFEPCGLTQMYALKYGTVPIVRATGGLADTVDEYIPVRKQGTGFEFHAYTPSDFAAALQRGLSIYQIPPHWDIIRRNGMRQSFSNILSGSRYIEMFQWALERQRSR